MDLLELVIDIAEASFAMLGGTFILLVVLTLLGELVREAINFFKKRK